jgi:hypothetical protein
MDYLVEDGDLAEYTLEQSFTLGVEWERVRQRLDRLDRGDARVFEEVVHRRNVDRLVAFVESRGYHASVDTLDYDNWVRLRVRPA